MPPHPLQHVLDKLDSPRRTASGFEARCPAHDDRHASLSVARGEDGRVLLHCHAGCSPSEVCGAIGIGMKDLFLQPESDGKRTPGRITHTYDYLDAGGQLLYQVVRYEPKAFRQRRPDPESPSRWKWSLNGTPRVLYRLPELLAADPGQWVFIVEGEKDADRLWDLGLIATTCPQGAGKWAKLSEDSALHGRRVAIVPDRDKPGRAHADDVAKRLTGRAAEVRIVELPNTPGAIPGAIPGAFPGVKDVSDWLDAGGTAEQLVALVEKAEPVAAQPPRAMPEPRGGVPNVVIDTDEHRVVAETIETLAADPDLFQRGAMLVRVIRDRQPRDGIVRSGSAATIQMLPTANLRERMTRWATFTKINSKFEEVAAHPPGWLVAAIDARGQWDGIRPLLGISDTPILRADGSICQVPGYDERTGVLYEPAPGEQFPPIHPEAGLDDADAALGELLEVVCDFRFETEEHQAAWLAALLTPLARHAFRGPAPLFLIDANVRGAGKGLLAQTIGHIVLGREVPVFSYAHSTEEMRKKITTVAIAGDRMVLLDNLEGTFGNDALDRALTSTRWKDRILGRSEQVDLPLLPVWYATGNNVQVGADTTRRVIHIRLDVLEEQPEHRTGFQHPDLLGWIRQQRGRLLAAALTILSAYIRSGMPDQHLTPFGSFEGWSRLVRQAVVWVGLPDPCLTRIRLVESADATGDALTSLVEAWRAYDPDNRGVFVAEMITALYPADGQSRLSDEASAGMRSALENLVGTQPGRPPSARKVGTRLRGFRRRVFRGWYLDCDEGKTAKGKRWRLHRVAAPAGSDCGDCDDCQIAAPANE